MEVFADEPHEIYKQAKKKKEWSKNLYVKIPLLTPRV